VPTNQCILILGKQFNKNIPLSEMHTAFTCQARMEERAEK